MNGLIENLKDIIRRYENDDECQHKTAKQWKLAAELLLEDCKLLQSIIACRTDGISKMVNCVNDRDIEISSLRLTIDALNDRIAELEKALGRTSEDRFAETKRADELAKRIDQAFELIKNRRGDKSGMYSNEVRNLIKILNGKDDE
jgi:hypothetical protein